MNQQEELKQLRELVEKLQSENHKLHVQNENLTQAVLHAQKKIFGQSSESSRHIEGQLALFAEEQLVEELATHQEKLTVPAHQRKPRKLGFVQKCLEICQRKSFVIKRKTNMVVRYVKAGVPKPVLSHLIVSPSVAARMLYQKYDMGIPLNRHEKD